MNTRTAEWLDALPEDTMIRMTFGGNPGRAARSDDPPDSSRWSLEAFGAMARYTSEDLLTMADPGSIRVVAVPPEALLSADMMEDSAGLLMLESEQAEFRANMRTAIGHVTGEQPG